MSGRSGRVDLLRGGAVLLVLLHHFNLAFPLRDTGLARILGPTFLQALARNGNYGVIIFFTVSGFLITHTAKERWGRVDKIEIGAFYRLRAARLLPCLLLLVGLVNLLGAMGLKLFQNQAGVPVWQGDLAALSGWMNVLMVQAGWFNYVLCVLWSLSVEMVFYAAFPWFCRLLRFEAGVIALLILVAVAGPIWRQTHQDDEALYLYHYAACFDAIAIGCGAALLEDWVKMRGPSRYLQQLAIAGAMAVFYLARPIAATNIYGVSIMALCTAMLLYPAPLPRGGFSAFVGWLVQPVRVCGRICYEIYLFHLVVLAGLRIMVPGAASWVLLVYLGASFVVSACVAQGFSGPLNRGLAGRLSARAKASAALTLPITSCWAPSPSRKRSRVCTQFLMPGCFCLW